MRGCCGISSRRFANKPQFYWRYLHGYRLMMPLLLFYEWTSQMSSFSWHSNAFGAIIIITWLKYNLILLRIRRFFFRWKSGYLSHSRKHSHSPFFERKKCRIIHEHTFVYEYTEHNVYFRNIPVFIQPQWIVLRLPMLSNWYTSKWWCWTRYSNCSLFIFSIMYDVLYNSIIIIIIIISSI